MLDPKSHQKNSRQSDADLDSFWDYYCCCYCWPFHRDYFAMFSCSQRWLSPLLACHWNINMKISWNCSKTSKLALLTSASAAPHSNSVCMFVSSSALAGLFWWAPARDRESSTMWKSTVVDRWSCPCVRRHLSLLLSTCPTSPCRFVAWLWPARCLRKEVYNWLERKCL